MTALGPTLPSAASARDGSYRGDKLLSTRWSSTAEFEPKQKRTNGRVYTTLIDTQCSRA
jgi:hypothetical protein